MSGLVETALTRWGMDGARHRLFAARENTVHLISFRGASYALRLHRRGYRQDAELISELEMMAAAGEAGILVPEPVRSRTGAFVETVGGVQIDVLTWLDGAPLDKGFGADASLPGAALVGAIGAQTARLHNAMDSWQPPEGFTRNSWDHAGLLGEAPLWGRFWENPTLTDSDRRLFQRFRDLAGADLAARAARLDFGLIHADLVRENVLIDGDRVQLIDFDDAGYGFRLFELATTLLKVMDAPAYPAIKTALLEGYRRHRPLDTEALDLFLVLRAATYVGWIASRLAEPGASERNSRFIATTRRLAQTYLAKAEHSA